MPNPGNPTLGAKLRKLRKEFRMTQGDVAGALGMNRTSFSKYETGMASPPLPVLRKLAAFYDVDLEYLIFDERTAIICLNDPQAEKKKKKDSLFIGELRQSERDIIMKYRLLPDVEKEKIYKIFYPEGKKEN